jgi:hypothetical protein
MTIFQILQIIVLGYSALVVIFVIFSTVFEFKNRFRSVEAKLEMFSVLNRLHGKYFVLNLFRTLSIVSMCAWLILALPLVDLFIGTHLISSFGKDENYATTVVTWIGTFSDTGNQGAYYFGTVLFSIIGVKGYWVVKRMADILKKDTLAVGITGMWGARSDFR